MAHGVGLGGLGEEGLEMMLDHGVERRGRGSALSVDGPGCGPVGHLGRRVPVSVCWGPLGSGRRLVIRGGNDAIHVADRLAAEEIPVILTSTMDAPGRAYEGYDSAYRRAADLYEAGVKFAISGGSSALNTDRLPYEAGVAVALGLPEEEALKAVTIYK